MNILLTGHLGGLGKAITAALYPLHEVYGYDIPNDVASPNRDLPSLFPASTSFDCLINCAGANKLGRIADFNMSEWLAILETNLVGPMAMTQALLKSPHDLKLVVNIISDADTRPMRCSSAYNASKAGLAMLTKQMARELSPEVVVFGISPGRLAGTPMSRDVDRQVAKVRGWSPSEVHSHQASGLLNGEVPPEILANLIAFLLSNRMNYNYLSGCIIPYGG